MHEYAFHLSFIEASKEEDGIEEDTLYTLPPLQSLNFRTYVDEIYG